MVEVKKPQSIYEPVPNPYGGWTTFEDVTKDLREAKEKVIGFAKQWATSKNLDPEYWFLYNGSEQYSKIVAHYDLEIKRAAQSFERPHPHKKLNKRSK